jgi:ubiquinone/menaquinone biosynthesis C-methylase UbiE
VSDKDEQIHRLWDAEAETYDKTIDHQPQTDLEWAIWTDVLARRLPTAPCRILDVGAGTGFLSLIAARLGHEVTALDFSANMLSILSDKARDEGLSISLVEARADQLPNETWDAVISRHLLWTLPDPLAALKSWRAAVPSGQMVLIDWSEALCHPLSARLLSRHLIWHAQRRLKLAKEPMSSDLRSELPLWLGTSPERIMSLIVKAGWRAPRLERLPDVDWVMSRQLTRLGRLIGVPPRYLVWAD